MIARTGHQLSELDRTLPKRHQASVAIYCPWEAKGTVMRRAMEHSEGKERLLVDGVCVVEGQHTVLLVPDKEESTFWVTAEADTADEAVALRTEYAALVEQWKSNN